MHSDSDEATAMLTLMGTEAVEGVAEGRNVEAIPNQDTFTIESNNRRS
jgi:hypothetical protein